MLEGSLLLLVQGRAPETVLDDLVEDRAPLLLLREVKVVVRPSLRAEKCRRLEQEGLIDDEALLEFVLPAALTIESDRVVRPEVARQRIKPPLRQHLLRGGQVPRHAAALAECCRLLAGAFLADMVLACVATQLGCRLVMLP